MERKEADLRGPKDLVTTRLQVASHAA